MSGKVEFGGVVIKTGTTDSPARPSTTAGPLLTEAEMREQWRREQAARERARCLGNCPDDLASFACGACALVYHPFAEITRRLVAEEAQDVQPFAGRCSQAVGFKCGERHWVVFRGTESFPETEMFLDWAHDLAFFPRGRPRRHRGFAQAWARIREPVLAWVASRGDGARFVLTGHSLGGALALLAAYDIAAEAKGAIDAVITFGSPRVGTRRWRACYHELKAGGDEKPTLRDVTFRIQNEGDIVTYLAPLILVHCGEPISSSCLQAKEIAWRPGALAGGLQEDIAEPGFFGRLKFGYRTARRTLPYSPLNLLVDFALAVMETAPQHYIRQYGPAFPNRAFRNLPAPQPPKREGAVNWLLFGVRWLIVIIGLISVTALCVLLYRVAPTVTGLVLFATIIYAVFGSPLLLVPPLSFVRPPFKPPADTKGG